MFYWCIHFFVGHLLNFPQVTATTSTPGPDGELVCQCILEAFRAEYGHPHGEVDQGELSRTGDESACSCMHYVKLWRVVCVRAHNVAFSYVRIRYRDIPGRVSSSGTSCDAIA